MGKCEALERVEKAKISGKIGNSIFLSKLQLRLLADSLEEKNIDGIKLCVGKSLKDSVKYTIELIAVDISSINEVAVPPNQTITLLASNKETAHPLNAEGNLVIVGLPVITGSSVVFHIDNNTGGGGPNVQTPPGT